MYFYRTSTEPEIERIWVILIWMYLDLCGLILIDWFHFIWVFIRGAGLERWQCDLCSHGNPNDCKRWLWIRTHFEKGCPFGFQRVSIDRVQLARGTPEDSIGFNKCLSWASGASTHLALRRSMPWCSTDWLAPRLQAARRNNRFARAPFAHPSVHTSCSYY
jgi:hypothetical protein